MTQYLKTDFDYNSSRLIEVFDELPLWAAPFGLKLLDKILYKKNISALDIGFGAGFPLTELAMRLGDSCTVYGIDPWEAAIQRAEKKISFFGIKNIRIIRGVAEKIPLQDQSIDLVVSNNGLNNVSDLDKSLGECARVMKKGGQFVQTLNLEGTMHEFYDLVESIFNELDMQSEIRKMKEQIYTKRKPLNELTSLIEKNNFKIETILHDSFDYHFADGTALFNHYFIRLAFLDGWKSFVPPDRWIEIFSLVEKRMNEEAEKNGGFKLTIPFALIDSVKK